MTGTSLNVRSAAQHVEPVDVGEPEVEDDDVGPAVGGHDDRGLAGRDFEHVEVAAAQRRAQRAPQRGVVFDEEDRAHGPTRSHGCAPDRDMRRMRAGRR